MNHGTKVTLSGLAGAVAAIIMWGLSLAGVTAPPGIETAIGVIVTVATQLLLPNLPDDPPVS